MHPAFLFHKIRTLFWTIFYRTLGRAIFSHQGNGCIFEGWIDIPQRSGRIYLGDRVRICRYVELSVPKGGVLRLQDDVLVSRGVMISAHSLVDIGRFSMVAEYVMIHDNNHEFGNAEVPIQRQGMPSADIVIGSDCWLCAGATIVKGARLDHGCVVAAGAVVNAAFGRNQVIGGVPAKVIGLR